MTPSGAWKATAGVGTVGYNFTAEFPGGDVFGHEIDSNPYGLLALPGGTLVADAGANTLDWVHNNGHISVVNRFPVPDPPEPFPTDAVPTCAAPGAGGLVVGDLAGRIWRQAGSSWQLVVNETGGNHFTGCAADAAGNVYLVSMFNSSGGPFPNPGTGSLVELAAGATTTTTIVEHLVFPNGITIGPGGTFYLSVNSVCPASPGGACGPLTGGVVKITP